jgi:hypothetical protein
MNISGSVGLKRRIVIVFAALRLGEENLKLEFVELVLYYSFARRAVDPMTSHLLTPACQFLLSHSNDKYSC